MTVSELLASLNRAADSPAILTEDERKEILATCDTLRTKLENPMEATIRYVLSPIQAVALELAVDMKLFDIAASLSPDKKGFGIDDLVSRMDKEADPTLVVRVVRFMVVMGIFKEVGPGQYTSAPLAGAYVSTSPLSQCVIHMNSQSKVITSLNAYFEENGYKSPGDAYNGPFQYARNTKLHCFDWLATQPRLQNAFNVVMTIPRGGKGPKWFEIFPTSSKLQVKSPEDVLLVDIGGGIGHDLIAFKKHFPDSPGTLIVQDIPVVVDSTENLPSGIQAMKHDMFTPQPIKSAKAYYLANVLHDWPDKQALKILGNIKEAMNEDSILLISENVLPDWNVPLASAYADFVMMANFSALERTEEQFKALLENAGFELVKAWAADDAPKSDGRRLLEAVPRK
ncbi:Uncharacterized protein BP5553_00859 [Venustampulla echinocandica]|uniref:O-methyltransferase C-terminal domain-containing protein n=1 Tax=Venustampulla echinocandica TaxID=2656787 RepID=A0A370TZE4_9HELO|nr:Uncharacterized protein BP5553_00859 [Venustampulla echinocandica]RDL40880.1 Uncharacterized protein BP5553_00859 [Venustampulla echinocandica]